MGIQAPAEVKYGLIDVYKRQGRNRDLKPVPAVGMETENPFPLQNKL